LLQKEQKRGKTGEKKLNENLEARKTSKLNATKTEGNCPKNMLTATKT